MDQSSINAESYATRRGIEIAERLSSGKDGIVFVAKRNITPARVAIKAHRSAETYMREKLAYQRLQETNTSSVRGFSVPKLVNFDDNLRVLEMTVRPLFAAAYLDQRPEFPPETWAEWEVEKREQFEDRWPIVQQILDSFEEFGMYLMDVSPANIAFPD